MIYLAKLKFKLVSIYAPKSQKEDILNRLQEMSVIDIETAALDEETDVSLYGFYKEDTVSKSEEFLNKATEGERALRLINTQFPEKKGLLSLFNSSRDINPKDFYAIEQESNAISENISNIIRIDKEIAKLKGDIVKLQNYILQLEPWKYLDISVDYKGTENTTAFIGTIVGKIQTEELMKRLESEYPDSNIHCEIFYVGKDSSFIFAICPKKEEGKTTEILSSLGFAKPTIVFTSNAVNEIEKTNNKISLLEEEISENKEKLKELSKNRKKIENYIDFCNTKSEKLKAFGRLGFTENTILIKGYVPEIDLNVLRDNLQNDFTVVIETEDVNENLAPVKLKNNWFASPAESLVEMYSLPSASDIDPTPLTGFFYYLFFGMMFSDAGYGLLMIIATSLALAKFKLSKGMRKSCKLFLYCGISTFLWGLIYGSFFGDSIAVLSEAFFGKRIALPALIDPMNGDAVTMLILSIGLGFVQIIAALCAKFVTCIRNGDKKGAFFDAGLWITTLLGIIIFALGLIVYKPVKTVGLWVTIASVVGLILTQGRDKKNPVMRIFSGIASLYDITGYVSDLLSFSRLMALGLTTSAMSAVFNMLSAMGGKSIGGFVMLIIIFPLGHAINFGLNVLGAYVHTLRLQYVELFSRFYEGGGRKFNPFKIKSKYTNINKETKEEN